MTETLESFQEMKKDLESKKQTFYPNFALLGIVTDWVVPVSHLRFLLVTTTTTKVY